AHEAGSAGDVEARRAALGKPVRDILRIAGVGNSLAHRVGGFKQEAVGKGTPQVSRGAVVVGIAVGLVPADVVEALAVSIERSVEKVARVAIDIRAVVEPVARGTNVIGVQNPTFVDFALNAEEPVVQ